MRSTKTWLLASILFLSLALVGAASAQGGDPERGGDLYVENCAVCHGENGQGRVGANLQEFPGIEVDAALVQTISEGVEGSVMPAWSEAEGGPLSEQAIEDIVAYIRAAFEGSDPIAPAPTYQPPDIEPLPEVEGDPSLGAVVYEQNCVMCHGDRGAGRFGAPLAKSWPGVEPAVYIQDVVHEGIEGTIMPAWSGDEGGPLSDDEIQNVTAYVLSLAPAQPAATPTATPEGPLSATVTLTALGILALLVIVGLVVYYIRA